MNTPLQRGIDVSHNHLPWRKYVSCSMFFAPEEMRCFSKYDKLAEHTYHCHCEEVNGNKAVISDGFESRIVDFKNEDKAA